MPRFVDAREQMLRAYHRARAHEIRSELRMAQLAERAKAHRPRKPGFLRRLLRFIRGGGD